tara:strand:- start:1336 stop:2412 length:1077 start_codon:yes stop_codon:yes gene_type:complete
MIKKKILIATGGTGGHIFPAISLANYLLSKNYNVQLTTDKRGFKYINKYDHLSLIKIPSSPLIKKNLLSILRSVFIIIFSILRSFLFLIINRPSIIFGMGGYSSFPICFAASLLKIKFVIYENNLIVGKANRFLLPFAQKILVSYKELEGIPKKYENKIKEIGNIIREEIINLNLTNSEDKLENIKILVLGGSQAAQIFAEQLPPIFVKLAEKGLKITVYQQCLKDQNSKLSKLYSKSNIDYNLFNFTDKIIDYYSKSNLVITRSGASVLAELINAKIPFISIPLPSSADNHQYKNAEFYFKKGYGYLLEEKDIKNKLFELINSIYKDNLSINKILSNQRQYSDKNIFKNLNSIIEKI